jgi:hypothetical protein
MIIPESLEREADELPMSKELKVIADFYDFISFNNFMLFMVA